MDLINKMELLHIDVEWEESCCCLRRDVRNTLCLLKCNRELQGIHLKWTDLQAAIRIVSIIQ